MHTRRQKYPEVQEAETTSAFPIQSQLLPENLPTVQASIPRVHLYSLQAQGLVEAADL